MQKSEAKQVSAHSKMRHKRESESYLLASLADQEGETRMEDLGCN